MGYKSKFKGAEIDARLEKMVNVTYAELKALRDEGKLIAGQMYRMTDYETTCTWENTKCAGHPFDLVLTALDNKTLDEKCSAIQSARDKAGYFANSDLAAWDVRYCLDNDTERFGWAQKGGKYLVADLSNFGMSSVSATLDGKMEFNGTTYIKWNAGFIGGATVLLLTASEIPKDGDEIIVYILENQNAAGTVPFVSLGTTVDGKGVIYRLTDESDNSVPYDFKNIMFMRPLFEGKFNAENGVATFCYTFCCIDLGTYAIEDQSVKEPLCCYNNKFAIYCYDNVFLTLSRENCYSNTFGDNCYRNTFGVACYYNTFGGNCYYNTFGGGCFSNAFGDDCYYNTFGGNCYYNTFGYRCFSNTFGDDCYYNTFGDSCSSNAFGGNCDYNTFGDNCDYNTFGDECYRNTFGDSCSRNTFGDHCSSNAFGGSCSSNAFVNSETASYRNLVQYYKIDCVSEKEIQVYRKRNYQTFITTDKNGNIVEYTVDDIINK